MDNISKCQNVSLDLTASSIRYTLHPQLLVVMATAMCLLAAFIVGVNILLILALVYSRYHGKYINRSDRYTGMSDNKKILSISFSLIQVVIGAFCMPLAIVQVVGNGHWNLGPAFCMARIYVEAITEVISIYHSVCMCLDTYIMVRKPFKYRLLTSRTGYGMSLFSWAIPIIIFALAIGLDWHTDGIREALYCLDAYNTCITLMSKKLLLFVLPISVIISLCALIAMAALVLKEIHRFHQNQDLHTQRNNVGKSNMDAERSSNHKDSHPWCANGCKLNSETFQDSVAKSRSGGVESRSPGQDGYSETSVSVIPNELHETETGSVKNTTPNVIIKGDNKSATTLPVNSKTHSKRKVFGVVISLTIMQCLYLLAFLIFASLFVYNTKMFPLWSISYITWLRYVHSAIIPAILLKNKPVGKLVRVFLKAI